MRAVAAGVGAVAAACVVAGAAGVAAGVHFTTAPPLAGTAVSVAPASADQVRAATVDLCTRFAVGRRAVRQPQRSPADVISTVEYIAGALKDNPAADAQIRAAVAESLRLDRGQAAWLSHAQAEGAIKPPDDPRDSQANAAEHRVWDLCRDYGS